MNTSHYLDESAPLLSSEPSEQSEYSSKLSNISITKSPTSPTPLLSPLGDNGISQAEQARKIARNTIYGMMLVALGQGFFTTVGAVVQHHGGSVLELLLGRYFFQNMIAWLVWFCRRPNDTNSYFSEPKHWYGDNPFRCNIWTRGFLYWIMIFCWFRGLELVPIGDAEAIIFLSPLVTVIGARIYLKEELPKVFFLTFFITIIGVTFICQPAFVFGSLISTSSSSSSDDNYEEISWQGLLFLLGAVFSWSAACILVRTAKEAHWVQLELVSSLQSCFIWTPLLIFFNRIWWKSDSLAGGEWIIDWDTFGIVIMISVLGFLALMFNVIGYQIGDATKVAWMEYLDLVFAFIFQWFAFDDQPNIWEFIGCGLLFTVCFVHLMEEAYVVWNKRKERNRLENEAKQDVMIMDETTMLITKNTKNTKEDMVQIGKEKIGSVVDRITSFTKLRQDSDYEEL